MAKKKKLSDREEWAIKTGRPKEEYPGSKKKKSKDSGGESVADMVKAILKATPAEQPVTENMSDFEKYYQDQGLEAADYEQAEALYKPYFEKQIAMELEDLNAWTASENVSYERSLRRARFALASSGGAIGTERESAEGEITQDHNANVQNKVRGVERNVGTQNINNAGYQSSGMEQKGELVDKMQGAIQEGQLWYKNLSAQKYFNTQKTYFQSPTNYSLSGSKL